MLGYTKTLCVQFKKIFFLKVSLEMLVQYGIILVMASKWRQTQHLVSDGRSLYFAFSNWNGKIFICSCFIGFEVEMAQADIFAT